MAQTVSPSASSREGPGSVPGPVHVGNGGGRSSTALRFSPLSIIPSSLHTHLHLLFIPGQMGRSLGTYGNVVSEILEQRIVEWLLSSAGGS